ncbi:MAG: hypothetical protein ACK5L3_08620 [Oscillospiraceae bacterium]
MTRKRFIKLLMAEGAQRNVAKSVARLASGNCSFLVLRLLIISPQFASTMDDLLSTLVNALENFVKNFVAAAQTAILSVEAELEIEETKKKEGFDNGKV